MPKLRNCFISGWNILHFASARTFVYTKMFPVHDRAHKNRVLMPSSCTGAKISAKPPLCQAVHKIQIRTNQPNVLCRPSLHLIRCFLKQYHVSRSNIEFLCPSYMLRFERALCMFLFWLQQGRFRTVGIISTIPEPKENYRGLLQPRSQVFFTVDNSKGSWERGWSSCDCVNTQRFNGTRLAPGGRPSRSIFVKGKLITKTWMSQKKLRLFFNWKSVHDLSCTVKAIACTTRAWFQSCTHFVPACYINSLNAKVATT